MPYKTILAVLNDTSRNEKILDAATSIAQRHESHLIGLYVIPAAQVYADGGMMGMPIVFEGYRDLFMEKMPQVRQDFDARMQKEKLSSEWRLIESPYPDISTSAIASCQSADLIVSSQNGNTAETRIENDFVDRLVMESGRPILIIPRHGRFAPPGEGITEKAVVGINGTPEASRAMFDAIPLLQYIDETRLVWVDPQMDWSSDSDVPGGEEAEALSRHGIKAVVDPMVTGDSNAGQSLLMRANDLGADLLVMGAYAHSRMREFVLGGATRHVLQQMNIPVFISH